MVYNVRFILFKSEIFHNKQITYKIIDMDKNGLFLKLEIKCNKNLTLFI